MNCANHDVAAVAFCRTCGKPLCSTCTRDVRGVIYCESCLAARLDGTTPAAGFTPVPIPPPQTGYQQFMDPSLGVQGLGVKVPPGPTSGPNPAVAGMLAGFLPFGVGAVYCSQYAKGLAHLVIVVLMIVGLSSNLPWYVDVVLAISLGFFYFYQIIDAVRTAKALQMGQAPPDPFGLAQTFGAGERTDNNTTKIPTGAVILIGLGVLFLLNTAGLFEFGLHRYWPLILIFLGGWLFAKQWGMIGSHRPRCICERCRTRRIMGPSVLVTLGVLFLLDSAGRIGFDRTWPALLLVIGIVQLVRSNASSEGHIAPLPPPPPGYPPTPPPPSDPNPPAGSSSEQPPSSGEVNHV
jgi:hypothetical protein